MNSSFLIISDILGKLFDFTYIFIVVNALGSVNFGIFTFWLSFAIIYNFTEDFGLGTVLVRDISREKSIAEEYFGEVLSFKLVLITANLVLFVLLVNLMNFDNTTRCVGYFITIGLFIKLFISNLFFPLFRAYEKMEYQAVGAILESLFLLCGAIFGVIMQFNVIEFSFLYLIAFIPNLLYCLIILRKKFFVLKFQMHYNRIWHSMRISLPVGISLVFSSSIYWIDVNILYFLKGKQATGLYGLADTLTKPFFTIPVILASVIFPVMSIYYVDSRIKLKSIVKRYIKYLTFLAVPMAVTLTLYSQEIIILLFDQEYLPSVVLLQIMSWTTALLFIKSFYTKFFQATDRDYLFLAISFFCMIMNIFISLILIEIYGSLGAAISRLLIVLLSVLLSIFASQFSDYSKLDYGSIIDFIKIIISSIPMVAFMLLTININLFNLKIVNLMFFVAFSGFLYIITFILLKGFDNEEISYALKVLNLRSLLKGRDT